MIFEYFLPLKFVGLTSQAVVFYQTVKLKLFSTASIMRDNLSFRRSSYTYARLTEEVVVEAGQGQGMLQFKMELKVLVVL